jgi:DNA polymerase III sliding clamp (beta) subunit (PCNA family)
VTFEIERNDWCEILADAAIFAGHDDTLPMLTCVRLQVGVGGQIVAAATDRFTLGRRTYQLDAKLPVAAEVLIPVREIEAMAKIHARSRHRGVPNPLTVTVTGSLPYVAERWDATGGSVRIASGFGGHREVVSTHPGMVLGHAYVDIDALIDKTVKAEAATPSAVGFRPEYVARFNRVSRFRGESMQLRLTSPDKPMIVTIGDHFVGLVMSVRIPAEATR